MKKWRAAADVLNAGKRVAILAGASALHATDEIIKVADLLKAGSAKALLGKAAFTKDEWQSYFICPLPPKNSPACQRYT